MRLVKFRVTNFRSVTDSGWIDTDNITCLIGTNEAGKTNLLIPLWKLNPAKGGKIDPLADYPRKRYSDLRSKDTPKPVFIEAVFEISGELVTQISQKSGFSQEQVRTVWVSRDFNDDLKVVFPDATVPKGIPISKIIELWQAALVELRKINKLKTEEEACNKILLMLEQQIEKMNSENLSDYTLEQLSEMLKVIDSGIPEQHSKTSSFIPRVIKLQDDLKDLIGILSKPSPETFDEIKKLIINNLPRFVYYSNYGNLDSEIYLPHVITNMSRENLGPTQEAKTRTLKVLFEFVKLQPNEILELGRENTSQSSPLSEDEIKKTAEKKKERDVLLQSASAQLTDSFRKWWKQGTYRFRFAADGDHFRIWVSDEKRTDDIELESRSSGLQWFFSFYLIFLVESRNSHKNAILLLDEPGLTLHPIAQRDLSKFFESLSQTNQILYTAHSPFMVDPDQLDRVKAVFVDNNGATCVSADLKITDSQPQQSHSIYPVYAALGLSVSSTLLEGCQAVIVEGPSDQYYLTAIKNYLIGKGKITPAREMIFLPSGGVSGIKAIIPIVSAKSDDLPYVILDSDRNGIDAAKNLISNLYSGSKDHVINIDNLTGLSDSEIEDILPPELFADIVTKQFRGPEKDFSEYYVAGRPIVPQIEAYAAEYHIALPAGWKVEAAKSFKSRLQKNNDCVSQDTREVEIWHNLFKRLLS